MSDRGILVGWYFGMLVFWYAGIWVCWYIGILEGILRKGLR